MFCSTTWVASNFHSITHFPKLTVRCWTIQFTVPALQQNGDRYDYNFRDGYVTSVSISEDGTRLAVALSFAEGSNYRTEIRVYKVGSSDYQMATCTILGIPYEIKIVEGGNIIAVGKNGINVFSSSIASTTS